jgi:hypothetical protein
MLSLVSECWQVSVIWLCKTQGKVGWKVKAKLTRKKGLSAALKLKQLLLL